MTLLNPSFEDAGAAPGQAAHWTLLTSVAAERLAGFGPNPHRAWEEYFDLDTIALSYRVHAIIRLLVQPARIQRENPEV